MNMHVLSSSTKGDLSITDLQYLRPLFLRKENLPKNIQEFAKKQDTWSYEHMTKKIFEVMFSENKWRNIYKKHRDRLGQNMSAFLLVDTLEEGDTEGISNQVLQRMKKIKTCFPHELTEQEMDGIQKGKYYMIPEFSSENYGCIVLFSIYDVEFFTQEIIKKVDELTSLNEDELWKILNSMNLIF